MFTKPYDEMTREEKLDHIEALVQALNAGDDKKIGIFGRHIPLFPELALTLKNALGSDYLIQNNFNLSRAEAEYGKNWLNH